MEICCGANTTYLCREWQMKMPQLYIMNKDGQILWQEWKNKSEDLKSLIGGYAILEIEKLHGLITNSNQLTENNEND